MFYELGGFMIPFLGGVLMDSVGFEAMCLFSSAAPLAFSLLFLARVVRPAGEARGKDGQPLLDQLELAE